MWQRKISENVLRQPLLFNFECREDWNLLNLELWNWKLCELTVELGCRKEWEIWKKINIEETIRRFKMLTFNIKTPYQKMWKEDNLSFKVKGHEIFIFYSITRFSVYLII